MLCLLGILVLTSPLIGLLIWVMISAGVKAILPMLISVAITSAVLFTTWLGICLLEKGGCL